VDVLYFQLGGEPYAIALEAIADVAPAGTIHPVPLAPAAVLGLSERRGRAVAVIDLTAVLGEPVPEVQGTPHVMRLAGPLAGAALLVPAQVFSGSGSKATDGHVWIDGRLHALLDVETLVKRAAPSP
jgi:purine-binding chemotaxis protein CheW